MSILNLEDFVSMYVDAVFETVQGNHLSNLDDFYEHVYATVSGKTGLSRAEIVSLHHPFHWVLFLEKNSFFELFNTGKKEDSCGIRVMEKNYLPRKKELTSSILEKYRVLLQQKLDKVSNHNA